MPLPTVTMTGNLTGDPMLRFTGSGKAVTSLRLACSERRRNKDTGTWEDGDTTFLDVTCWRNAEEVADKLTKGQTVIVSGVLRQRTYQAKDGTDRTTYEVTADDVALVVKSQGGYAPKPEAVSTDPWPSTWSGNADEAPF